MKKQLLSIIAIILCFCTVLALASCGKESELDGSDSNESLNEGTSNGVDVGEGLENVDDVTAEDIFAQMKAAYKATVDYKNGYALNIKWQTNQTDDETDNSVGKGDTQKQESVSSEKYVTTETVTADPSANKAAFILSMDVYENNKKTTSSAMEAKIFNQNSKNYLYSSSKTDGQLDYEDYSILTEYGLAEQKEAMLLSYYFGADSHFAEGFGDPFSASSASDLKTIHTTVINEVKANQKAKYEADGYTVKALTAKADIIFNKEKDTNLFKRIITISADLQYEGGTYQANTTIDSLLKTKDGKILSFASITTQTINDKTGDSYSLHTETTSELSYEFEYAMNNTTFDSIKTTIPAAGVPTAMDYFEVPVTLYINGEEVVVSIIGECGEGKTPGDVLKSTLDDMFADTNIEFDGKWYTDASCTKELNTSSITTIEKLKSVGKLYNNSFKVAGSYGLFIDSGKETVNVPKNYTIVFGGVSEGSILDCKIELDEYSEDNFTHRVSYDPHAGYDVTVKLNGKELKYSDNLEESDFQEESAGEFFHEFAFDSGKIYFIKRSNVITKNSYTLENFYVNF